MRNRDVIEFLGLWERLHNPDFNPLEFEGVRKQAGANAFTMSPKKWIEATGAVGIVSKAGRYKENLIPSELTPAQVVCTYANEADMLNVVLFGKWRSNGRMKIRLLKEICGMQQR